MASDLDYIDEIQKNLIEEERICHRIDALNKIIGMKKDFILLVNIRSLNANFTNLQLFIGNLDTAPSVIVCTETRVLQSYMFFSLPGYKMYYNHSEINITDGVVVYIKEDISESTEVVKVGKLSIVNTCIYLENKKKLEISALYRAHDLPKPEFVSELKKYLVSKKKIENHLLLGDFNIDLIKLDLIGYEHLNNLMENEFRPGFQTITRPSQQDSRLGSCIDNIFIKSESFESLAIKYENLFNDHYPLFLQIDKINGQKPVYSQQFLNYQKLKKIANSVSWNSIKGLQDPNEAIDLLIEGIQYCIQEAMQPKKVSLHSKDKPRSKWVTSAIIVSCKKKEFLYNLKKINPTNENLNNEYKNYCKILEKVVAQAKKLHEKKELEKVANDKKKLWNFVSQRLGKRTRKDGCIKYLVNNDNVKIEDPKEIAENLNDYFSGIGVELCKKIGNPNNASYISPPLNTHTIFLQPVDFYEIYKIILNLKLKNGGVDNINAKTLITLIDFITEPLTHIINLCIEESVFPDSLKKAEITPVHKSGKKIYMTNYRPISLISNLAKIFEKAIHCRLLQFFHKYGIITKRQYGFLRKVGTCNALDFITNLIYETLDKNQHIAVTFLDLAKAFDTIDHDLLLSKLYCYGIRGNAHNLLKSYLTGRKQRVKVNGVKSEYCYVKTGVPQGTILGPLLFVIYVNDLLERMPEDMLVSFADDTAVLSADETWQKVQDKMNLYLDKTYNWLATNKLSLNISKTVFITFGAYTDSVPKNFEIKIKNQKLVRVESCKYLGIIFDCNMKWCEHIEHIVNKTKYLVFIFRKLANIMQKETLITLYYAFFQSIINYGIIAWGGAYATALNMLQSLQNKILKIIFKNRQEIENYPLNIEQLFTLESLKFHYAVLKDLFVNSTSVTRNKNIQLPKMNKTLSSKNSKIRAITTFNMLPNELKTLNSNAIVKKKIKIWIRQNL